MVELRKIHCRNAKEYYSVIKIDKILYFVTQWIQPSEISQSQTDKYIFPWSVIIQSTKNVIYMNKIDILGFDYYLQPLSILLRNIRLFYFYFLLCDYAFIGGVTVVKSQTWNENKSHCKNWERGRKKEAGGEEWRQDRGHGGKYCYVLYLYHERHEIRSLYITKEAN